MGSFHLYLEFLCFDFKKQWSRGRKPQRTEVLCENKHAPKENTNIRFRRCSFNRVEMCKQA